MSSRDICVLLLGAVPLAIIAFRGVRWQRLEFFRLYALALTIFWAGFHLTPWISVWTGGWESALLRPQQVTTGLVFSTGFIWAILAGAGASQQRSHDSLQIISTAGAGWLVPGGLLLASLAFALSVFSEGSFGEFLSSSLLRGSGQFDPRTAAANMAAAAATLSVMAGVVAVLLISFAMARESVGFGAVLSLCTVIFLGSAELWSSFSRASGALPMIAAIGILAFRCRPVGLSAISGAALLLYGGVCLSLAGLQLRFLNPGYWNFIEAIALYGTGNLRIPLDIVAGTPSVGPELNFLNALDAFTASAHYASGQPALPMGMWQLAGILNPIPSFLLSYPLRVGPSLAWELGTYGSTGITTPALAELYFLIGMGGMLAGFGIGRICRHVQGGMDRGQMRYLVAYVLVIAGCVISLHSGIRAGSRPFIYAYLYLAACWFAMHHPFRSMRVAPTERSRR